MLHISALFLCVCYAAASPVIEFKYDDDESNSKYADCFNPEEVYDPVTGYVTYRCPDVKVVVEEIFLDKKPTFNLNKLRMSYINEIDSNPLKEISEETFVADEPSDDDDEQMYYEVIDIEAKKPLSKIIKNKNKNAFPLKNQDKKNEDECKLNCCPEGQMYQSELDICIDFTPGPAHPSVASSEQSRNEEANKKPSSIFHPSVASSEQSKNEEANKKPSTIFITDSQEEQPQADAPEAKPQKNNQESVTIKPWVGKIISVGKFDLKNRCKDNEFYLSELDICVSLDK